MPQQNDRYLFTSESVSMGHPDKMADQISDGILDAIFAQDPYARVACETLLTTGLVVPGRRDHDHGAGRLPERRPPGRRGDRLHLQRHGLRRHDLRGDGRPGQAVARHRPGGRRGRRQGQGHGAGDQGLMFGYACERDPRADAAADRPVAPDHQPDHRAAPGRHDQVAPARRQEPGDRRVRGRQAGPDRHGRRLDPAPTATSIAGRSARRSRSR